MPVCLSYIAGQCCGVSGECGGRVEWGWNRAGGGSVPGGVGTSRSLLQQILCPTSGWEARHGASQIFTSKIAGAERNSPIVGPGALLRERDEHLLCFRRRHLPRSPQDAVAANLASLLLWMMGSLRLVCLCAFWLRSPTFISSMPTLSLSAGWNDPLLRHPWSSEKPIRRSISKLSPIWWCRGSQLL